MIKPICASSLSFRANYISARDAYDAKKKQNSQIAADQNNKIQNNVAKNFNYQIPMQGQGHKLDIVA